MGHSSSKMQFGVYLPVELVQELKHKAVELDMNFSVLVEQSLEHYLKQLDLPKTGQRQETTT